MPSSSPGSGDESVSSDDRLLRLIGDTGALLEIVEFRHELLLALHRTLSADWVSINDIGPDPGTIVGIVEPSLTVTTEQQQVFAEFAYQNPLIDRYSRSRDGRALRVSDLVTADEFHELEIYTRFYALVGVEYQIAFTLPHDKDRILGVAISRRAAAGDFTDAERDLLNRARPFLIQAYRNSVRYSEALATRTPRSGTEPIPDRQRLVALGLTGRQAEVLQLLATGASEHDIATRLGISQRTVQKHLQRCYRRLGVTNRSHAGAIAWSTIDAARASTRMASS